MRGKEKITLEGMTSIGITPAYAGKSPSAATFSRGCRDHPRLCGEKEMIRFSKNCGHGITPAYAGKSDIIGYVGCTG